MKGETLILISSCLLVLPRGDGRFIRATQCDVECPQKDNPVCAKCNGELKTFANPCLIRRENECNLTRCVIQSHGPCGENMFDCNKSCSSFHIETFCAKENHRYTTFHNKCQMEKQNICAKQHYRFVSHGECKTV